MLGKGGRVGTGGIAEPLPLVLFPLELAANKPLKPGFDRRPGLEIVA